MATERNLPTESAAARWLLAVCQAAAGRFGSALEALDGLLPVTTEAPPERQGDAALLNGPKLEEDVGHVSQDDIDALFP